MMIVPTKSPIEVLDDAYSDLLAAQGVVGVSIDGRDPGNSKLSIRPAEAFKAGVELVGENLGEGSPRFIIKDRKQALWLASQLQRIFT